MAQLRTAIVHQLSSIWDQFDRSVPGFDPYVPGAGDRMTEVAILLLSVALPRYITPQKAGWLGACNRIQF
jgi:hypothetical protein